MKEIDRLQPRAFTKFCMSIGAVPSSYIAGLTIEEQLLWFCSYLEKNVIPAINNNAEAVEELQTLYTQLKSYVDNYFDNLDVQEEINNKLDEMADSGQLTDIIAQYLQLAGVLAYDTKTAMKAAENLVDGSITKTLGNLAYNDGYGAFYKVRQVQNTDVIDDENIIALYDPDLVAEKIPDEKINNIEKNIEKNTNGFKLNLMRDCIYDLPNSNYTQGSCVVGNKLYILQPTSDNNGNIVVLNLEDKSYDSTISNVLMYHGGDCAALNNKIYIAPYDGTIGKTLIVYDIANNTTSQITPFQVSEKQTISGVANYGDKLLCSLENISLPYAKINEKEFYLYDTITEEVTELSYYNPNNIKVNSAYATQGTACVNNHYYISTSLDNNLFDFIIDEENERIELSQIYNLPYFDNSGLIIGEYEGLSNALIFGNNALMISTHIVDNESTGTRTLKTYVIDPVANTPNFEMSSTTDVTVEGKSPDVILDSTSTSLYEDGSTTYPYKTLVRAISATQRKNIRLNACGIYVKGSTQQSYYAGDIININNLRITFMDNKQHKIYIRRILGSQIYITTGVDFNSTPGNVYFNDYNGATYGQIVNTNLKLDSVNLYTLGANLRVRFSTVHFSNIPLIDCAGSVFMITDRNCIIYDGAPYPTFHGDSATPISYYLLHSSKLFLGSSSYTTTDVGALDSGKKIQASLTSCIVVFPGVHGGD